MPCQMKISKIDTDTIVTTTGAMCEIVLNCYLRLSEYKIKSNVPDQETRRKRILEEQKRYSMCVRKGRNLQTNCTKCVHKLLTSCVSVCTACFYVLK